jgi:hypothetical protein
MQGSADPSRTAAACFADTGPDVALDLVDARPTPNGATIQVFRPSGQPEYATSTAKQSGDNARRGLAAAY